VLRKRRMTNMVVACVLVAFIAAVVQHFWRGPRPLLQVATKVIALRPSEWGIGFNGHTLVLVTTVKDSTFPDPTDWVGRVDILDTSTGKRVPAPGLTRMLNSLHEIPVECDPSPDGKWLLWTVTGGMDRYPIFYVSTLDGSRHYHWEAGKFDTTSWLNDPIWLVRDHQSSEEQPMIHLYDVNVPQRPRKMRANAADTRSLITDLAAWKSAFDIDDTNQQAANEVTIAEYDAAESYLVDNPIPKHNSPVPIPATASVQDVKVSPDHSHLLLTLSDVQTKPLQQLLHRFIPAMPLAATMVKSLWTSRTDGTDMHEMGYLEFKDEVEFDNYQWRQLQWPSDSKHIAFRYGKSIYMVSNR
jgi:hypothetical protein